MSSEETTAGQTYPASAGSTCLFIGGLADGRRIAISHDMQFVRLPVRTEQGYEESEYRLEILMALTRTFRIYVATQLPLETAIERLIDGYASNNDSPSA